ncbi:NIF3-like protein 1 [Argonauta hians]
MKYTSRFLSVGRLLYVGINREVNPRTVLNPYKNLCSQTSEISEMSASKKGNLNKIVTLISGFMPPSLAESWDNVGLLVEPSLPHNVSKILLTNDLTPEVLDEAVEINANFILSYHPPIFSPLKRLCQGSWKQKLIVRAIENRIAIYSPHTSCDALNGGVNDWLISAFDNESVSALSSKEDPAFKFSHCVSVSCDTENRSFLLKDLTEIKGVSLISDTLEGDSGVCVKFLCTESSLQNVAKTFSSHPVNNPVFTKVAKPPLTDTGIGRISKLKSKISLTESIDLVKKHLKLPHLRVATAHGPGFSAAEETIKTVAVCAGSGASVLRGVKADLYVTGEMSHHEVLEAIHNGSSVLLCEHSNTERGYLDNLKTSLENLLAEISPEVCISKVDADPLRVY